MKIPEIKLIKNITIGEWDPNIEGYSKKYFREKPIEVFEPSLEMYKDDGTFVEGNYNNLMYLQNKFILYAMFSLDSTYFIDKDISKWNVLSYETVY